MLQLYRANMSGKSTQVVVRSDLNKTNQVLKVIQRHKTVCFIQMHLQNEGRWHKVRLLDSGRLEGGYDFE